MPKENEKILFNLFQRYIKDEFNAKDRVEIERFQREISKKSASPQNVFKTSVFVDDVELREKHNIRQIEFVSNISNLTRINTVFSVPLKELKFENIKSFESVEIYPNKLNLFAGKNSSGKSTILETIALLTNWSHTKNHVYSGIAFKHDFGIKNFNEFKSNFAALNEDVVLKILSTNILKDNQEIGNARININFGKLKEDDGALSDLKYAPIKSLRLEFDDSKQFDSKKEDRIEALIPTHTVIEYSRNNGFTQRFSNNITLGLNTMHQHYDKFDPTQDRDSLDFPGFMFRDGVKRSKDFYKSLHKNKLDIQKVILEDNILDNFVDISVNLTKDGIASTRLLGCFFSSGDKEFKNINKVNNIEYFLPINQNHLIRWLAMDYINHKSQSVKKGSITSWIGSDLLTAYNQYIVESEKSEKEIKDNILGELFQLNLKYSNKQFNFLGLFECPIGIQSSKKNFNLLSLHNLIDWILNGKKSLKPIEENLQIRKDSYMDKKYGDFDLDELNKRFNEFERFSFMLINSADEAIVEISGGADPLKAIKGMYAEIDKILKTTDFPINLYDMDTWNKVRNFVLEQLSVNHLRESNLDPEKTVLIPFAAEVLTGEGRLSFKEDSEKDSFINVNDSLKNSFENLFSATFIGPLRERSEFQDDIFSFNYPLTFGIKGEKIVSFLSTFDDRIIKFPVPKIIDDLEKHSLLDVNKYIKEGSFYFHLSNWLKFLDLGEELKLSNNGELEIINKNLSEKTHSLDNIGVGVSQVLPVLLSCMVSQTNLLDGTYFDNSTNQVLLLEQPELHLHPSAQAKLADFFVAVSLTNQKTLFIETHSDHIFNRLRLRKIQLDENENFINIFFTSKSKKGVSNISEFTINPDGSYDFDSYPSGFFDQTQLEAREIAKALNKKDKK